MTLVGQDNLSLGYVVKTNKVQDPAGVRLSNNAELRAQGANAQTGELQSTTLDSTQVPNTPNVIELAPPEAITFQAERGGEIGQPPKVGSYTLRKSLLNNKAFNTMPDLTQSSSSLRQLSLQKSFLNAKKDQSSQIRQRETMIHASLKVAFHVLC